MPRAQNDAAESTVLGEMPVFFKVGSAAAHHISKKRPFLFPYGDTETHLPSPNYTQHCHKASLSDDVNVVLRKDSTKMCHSAYERRRPRRNRSRRRKQDSPPFPFLTRGEIAECRRALCRASVITRINRKHISRPPLHTHTGARPPTEICTTGRRVREGMRKQGLSY